MSDQEHSSSSTRGSNKRKRSRRDKPSKTKRIKSLESKMDTLTDLVKSIVSRRSTSRSTGVSRRSKSRSLSSSSSDDSSSSASSAHKKSDNCHKRKSDTRSEKGSSPCKGLSNEQRGAESQPQVGNSNEEILEITVADEGLNDLLGNPVVTTETGKHIHPELAVRWATLAKKGMPKEERDKIREKWKPPSNCKYGGAPLNPELGKAVNSFTKTRDEDLNRIQTNVEVALTGLGQILTTMLDESKELPKSEVISHLSDVSRFLLGTQYQLSSFRRKQIKVSVKDSAVQDLLTTLPIYPQLFGDELSAKIKQTQSLTKMTNEIQSKGQESKQRPKESRSSGSFSSRPRAEDKNKSSLNYRRPFQYNQYRSQKGNGRFNRKRT